MPTNVSKPIDAPSNTQPSRRDANTDNAQQAQSTGASVPRSYSARFSNDNVLIEADTYAGSFAPTSTSRSPSRERTARDVIEQASSDAEDGYPQFSSSFTDTGHRSSSFGIGPPSHGFPSSSAYSYKAMISKHGHGFPDRAESVRNISALANLVDYRSNYYEDHRISEEEIKHRTKHLSWAKASAVCDYYERLNETLDGWREVDEILDSRFPDEVMRRFEEQHELDAKRQRRGQQKVKRRPKHHHHHNARPKPVESDGNVSDEEETKEDERGRSRSGLKRSFSAKAIDALQGWFGASGSPRASSRPDIERGRPPRSSRHDHHRPKGRAFDLASATEEDEPDEQDQDEQRNGQTGLSQSPPRIEDDTQAQSGRRDYGATASTAGQLFDKLRREGRIEQMRRSESQLALSSGASTPGAGIGTQTPREGAPSRANTIRPNQVENIPEDGDPAVLNKDSSRFENGKIIRTSNKKGSLDRDLSLERHHRPYASQEEERQALLSTVPNRAKEEETSRSVQFAININLLINILLLGGKGVAVLSSNSVSLIASFIDSALDLLSTIIIFATSKAIAYRSWRTIYKYPVGKQRLEPLGVVIFSVLMIASFVQVFIESVGRLREVLATGQNDPDSAANLPLIGVAFMLATIGIKTVMWLLYRSSKSSGVRAVAQDAENDVVFNVASLIFPILGSWLGWPALDPIGGIVLSIYIIYEWIETLWETVSKLSGAVASATEISKCLYCVVRFNSVNSVSAFELFHSGDNLIVEADIVLPHSISLKESHDLGEIITYCTENISEVERSYIHLDYNPKGQAGHLTQRG